MGLPEVIRVDKEKCQHCLACLRVCPVKLCNIVETDGILVNSDLCIGCGECIKACREKGHFARSGLDDFPEFTAALETGVPLGILVAPSAAVNFHPHFGQMLTALRNMGVAKVFDVSFGAEITTYLYAKALQSGLTPPIIAQPCPAIVSYIEIYQPELVPHLAPTHSPVVDAAVWLKNQPEFEHLQLAFLGPCLAKRREVHDPNTKGVVSYNVTFESLAAHFEQAGIDLSALAESGFDTPEAERAVVYSQPGGLTETFRRFGIPVRKADIPRVEGPQEVYLSYLPELAKDITEGRAPLLVDILNCSHGCNVGPASTHCRSRYQIDQVIEARMEEQVQKHQASGQDRETLQEFYQGLDAQNLDFSRSYTDKSAENHLRTPTPEEEEHIWNLMHKATKEERGINCTSCGYEDCRDMMVAVANGLNHIESCKYYLFKENELHVRQLEDQAVEIEEQRDEIAAMNEELEETVELRTRELRNLLNNAGQGFLSFGADLMIHDEYSSECLRIFGRQIDGQKFSSLIYPRDAEQRIFLETLFAEVFAHPDELDRELYLPLLPTEITVGDKHVQLEYKMIKYADRLGAETCMAILTDVTGRRVLESQVEQERDMLKKVVKVVANFTDFRQNVKDFEQFHQLRIGEILSADYALDAKINELLRAIHTFKGNFSQLGMSFVSEKLHDLESRLSGFRLDWDIQGSVPGIDETAPLESLRELLESMPFQSWLEVELEYLQQILGQEFLDKDEELVISKAKLLEIEKKMEILLPPTECRALLPEIRRLRYMPFGRLLQSYPEYTLRLAERQEKQLHPFDIDGEEILVNPDRYTGFAKSLVHVFRNALDHGLETADERIELGKDEYGKVSCQVLNENGNLVVTIWDDGRGIDPQRLKGRALEKGLLGEIELEWMTDEEVLQLIFDDGFSTKDTVTAVSGRGVGLAAVKQELLNLGGTVQVASQVGQGTEFKFTLQLESEETWGIPISELMTPLVETTTNYLQEQAGLEVQSLGSFEIWEPSKLELHKFTSFVTIRGALDSSFIFSADEKVLSSIVEQLVLGELSPEEKNLYMEDVLSESTNTILGNSIKAFPGLEELLVIDAPIALSSDDALVRYTNSEVWTCDISTNHGLLKLGLVNPQMT